MSELSADQFSSSDSSAPTPAPSSSESTSSPPPPQESSPSSSSTAPPAQAHGHGHFSHAKPLAPSVSRLLATSSLTPEQVKNLKGSGRDGYLTKGDVLKAMGKIATVWGTKEAETLEKAGKRGVMERFAVRSLPSTFSHQSRALGSLSLTSTIDVSPPHDPLAQRDLPAPRRLQEARSRQEAPSATPGRPLAPPSRPLRVCRLLYPQGGSRWKGLVRRVDRGLPGQEDAAR